MSDEPTRRIPPADDPTQIQRPPARPGTQPGAPSSYAATQWMDAVQDGQPGRGGQAGPAGQSRQAAWPGQGGAAHGDRTQMMPPAGAPQGNAGYGDQTQVMPPSGTPQAGAGYGDQTQVIPPSGMPQQGAGQGRDFRAATPPPARPYRPYETGQPTQAHAAAFPGEPGYGQGQAGGQPTQAYGQQPVQPTQAYGQAGQQPVSRPQPYDQGYSDQGYNPQAQQTPPTPPFPRRERDRGDDSPGGSAAGAVLAWIPRILLALSVYQLVRLIPGFDVMPDVSQFPLFRGIGDGVLGLLNLNPEWSDQAANMTIPALGIALAGLLNTIRSLGTSLAIWPYGLAVVAWIVVFAVGGIVGYAQQATENIQQDVQNSVDETVEDAKKDAQDSVEQQIEQGVDDARQNATDQLEDALPGGNG